MIQKFYNLEINTNGQRLYEFTDDTIQWIKKSRFSGTHNLIKIDSRVSFFQLFIKKKIQGPNYSKKIITQKKNQTLVWTGRTPAPPPPHPNPPHQQRNGDF